MAIQFPARYGVEAPQPAAAGGNATHGHAPDPRGPAPTASTPQAVVDSLVLQGAAVAALELDLLSRWDDGAAQARGAAEFQLARAAAQAAMRAQQIAEDSRIEPFGKLSTGRTLRVRNMRTPGPARRAARRLWDKLPLLAILLGWLLAGIVGGLASLPFQEGYASETRQTLFSIWAIGLLAMVLAGFVRSILRL